VQALTKRWLCLLDWTTGGGPGIEQPLKRQWEEQGDAVAAQFGSKYDSRPVWGYINKAQLLRILLGRNQLLLLLHHLHRRLELTNLAAN